MTTTHERIERHHCVARGDGLCTGVRWPSRHCRRTPRCPRAWVPPAPACPPTARAVCARGRRPSRIDARQGLHREHALRPVGAVPTPRSRRWRQWRPHRRTARATPRASSNTIGGGRAATAHGQGSAASGRRDRIPLPGLAEEVAARRAEQQQPVVGPRLIRGRTSTGCAARLDHVHVLPSSATFRRARTASDANPVEYDAPDERQNSSSPRFDAMGHLHPPGSTATGSAQGGRSEQTNEA